MEPEPPRRVSPRPRRLPPRLQRFVSRSRRFPLWPRRLRWRLVGGFVLTVALLMAVLTGAERVLVEQALVDAIRSNLDSTVRTGLAETLKARPSFSSASWSVVGGDVSALDAELRQYAKMASDLAGANPGLSKQKLQLVAAMKASIDLTARVRDLTTALTVLNQPAAVIDSRGQVLAAAPPFLVQDKLLRKQRLGLAVMKSLLAAARARAAGLGDEWSGRVATVDGSYLLLLVPTTVEVLSTQQTNAMVDALGSQSASATIASSVGAKSPSRAGTKSAVPSRAQAVSPGAKERAAACADCLVVLIGHRLAETEQTVQTVTAIGALGSLAVLALAVLLSLAVVGRALRPLAAITCGAERLARGDYAHRVPVESAADEVGRLGATFNHMAAEIAHAFAAQRRFVADASHELRTPLAALRGYTDVLILGVDEDRATADRVLHAMQDDLSRMSRLVDDLLMLARLDADVPLRLGPVALSELLGAAAEEGRALARGTRWVQLDPPAGEVQIWGDKDRLRQVLSNVVGNACSYCPPGSTVRLSAAVCHPWATIAVQDDGPGVPASDVARLGERFYRGDAARSRRTGGTGLGLAIARAITEAHGGTLAIDSTLGVGTTVTIRLPLAHAAPSRPLHQGES